jgi:murein DD-endopeptidase MepM/ murein hydrolase activator NlpD
MALKSRAPRLRLAATLAVGAGLLSGCGWMAVPPPASRGAAGGGAPSPVAAAPAPPGSVVVQPGDTVYAIARRSSAPIRAIIEANNLQPPFVLRPGQTLVVPHPQTHLVKPGETVYGIARQNGVEAAALVKANDIAPPYKILVGQLLILPGQAESAPAAAQPASPVEIQRVEQLPPQPGAAAVAAQGPAAGGAAPPAPMAQQARGPQAVSQPQMVSQAESRRGVVAMPLAPPSAAATPAASSAAGPSVPTAGASQPVSDETGAGAMPPSGSKLAALPPAEAPAIAHGSGRFLWPLQGKIISGFGPKEGGLFNDGINIAAAPGTKVVAADDGVVAYAGNEIRGFGNLVLIKHANGWMTAYAHNETLLVKRGEHVTRGQVIARTGSSGSVSTPQLHFEVRKDSHPVDPLKYLAALSS